MTAVSIAAWLGLAAIVAGVLYMVRQSGKDADAADALGAGKRIADAEKDRATSLDDIAERLRNGGKL